jgi:hypothetical protein
MSVAYSVGVSLLFDDNEERRAAFVEWLAQQEGVGPFRDASKPGGKSMPSDFFVYVEDLMEADVLLPEVTEGMEVDASAFADVLRLEGRTTLRLHSHAWAREVAQGLLAEATDLEEECPDEAKDLQEFCTQLLADIDCAGEQRVALTIGIE